MSDEKDYKAEDDAAIRAIQRRLDRQEALTEASKDMIKKLAKEAFKDKQTRNSIARDCIEGIQGRKTGDTSYRKLAKDGGRVPGNLIDEPLPTGFEKTYWQEDDEE